MDIRGAVIGVCVLLCAVKGGRHDACSRHTVHGVYLRDTNDQRLLNELQHKLDLDIWEYGQPAGKPALVMLSPEQAVTALNELDKAGIIHFLEAANVTKVLKDFDNKLINYQRSRSSMAAFENYPRHSEINAYLETVADQYPDIVTLVTAGQSWEGRDIKYLKISTTNFTDTSKPIYFMNAMLHAREWVTTPVALYSIHRLVEDVMDQDRDLLEGTDWIVLPLSNPDGYEYSHTDERMWRRTRSNRPEISTTCVGVDGNRNFNASFLAIPGGASTDPCSQSYAGPHAFSEPETSIIRDILHEHVDRIQFFLDIHSSGNYVIYPYGDGSLTSNAVQLHHIASVMGAAIDTMKLDAAGFYRVGNSALMMYPTAGASDDYAKLVGAPFSVCIELPGYGYGFLVPPEFIDHINRETWHGIAASARVAKLHYNKRINRL